MNSPQHISLAECTAFPASSPKHLQTRRYKSRPSGYRDLLILEEIVRSQPGKQQTQDDRRDEEDDARDPQSLADPFLVLEPLAVSIKPSHLMEKVSFFFLRSGQRSDFGATLGNEYKS